jgi:hypothetical protein
LTEKFAAGGGRGLCERVSGGDINPNRFEELSWLGGGLKISAPLGHHKLNILDLQLHTHLALETLMFRGFRRSKGQIKLPTVGSETKKGNLALLSL